MCSNTAAHLFEMVGLPMRLANMYPHELSGGMKQRVCIAMAIALNPTVIIADEFTSALDVVVQRVVAQTMLKVKEMLGVSIIMIGHDMGLMAQMVDRIAVMYAGKIVEDRPAIARLPSGTPLFAVIDRGGPRSKSVNRGDRGSPTIRATLRRADLSKCAARL
jgi:ABC-type dipeptide/oligopeptide/nickel transport system ATPase component